MGLQNLFLFRHKQHLLHSERIHIKIGLLCPLNIEQQETATVDSTEINLIKQKIKQEISFFLKVNIHIFQNQCIFQHQS